MTYATRSNAILILAFTLAIGANSAMAHGDALHPDTLKAAHGGQLGVAGSYGHELVVVKDAKDLKASPIEVYVTDHAGQKISTAAATGTATILAGKQKSAATLRPDGDNRMKGMANYTATPDMKVVVSITLAGKPPEQTRFTPLATAKDGHSDHPH